MNTTRTSPLTALELCSVPLQATVDLGGLVALQLAGIADDLADVEQLTADLLGQLDSALDHDPIDGTVALLNAARTAQEVADRRAFVQLLRHAGADLLAVPAQPEGWPVPPRKRRLTDLEAVWVRLTAIELGARHVGIIGSLEAGAAPGELADLAPEQLLHEGQTWRLMLDGDRDRAPRTLTLPAWTWPHLGPLFDRAEQPWLLHDSRATTTKNRECTLLMAVNATLKTAKLSWPKTVTALSVQRTALTRLATDGPDGFDRAVAAAGHHNLQVTDRLLRLAKPW